ncbi:MAG: 5'-nucleotidase C-terminal domain-containing protein [Chitinophagaceae bacterium]|nr:5'-nucleotidase C-terminal domain-containing protein [Chitinophagaceae bacterium]
MNFPTSFFSPLPKLLLVFAIAFSFFGGINKASAQAEKKPKGYKKYKDYNYKEKWRKDDTAIYKPTDTVIFTQVPLTKALPECTLGNWITDAIKAEVSSAKKIRVYICMISYSSIGVDFVAPGPILQKDISQIIPYKNQLKIIRISGKNLRSICDGIIANKGIPLSGMQIEIEGSMAKNILVNGQPINEHLIYILLINDYLLKDRNLGEILSNQNTTPLWMDLRTTLAQAAKKSMELGITINAKLTDRIKYLD